MRALFKGEDALLHAKAMLRRDASISQLFGADAANARPCFGDENMGLFKGTHVANRVAALRTALVRAVHEKKAVVQRLGIPSTAALEAMDARIDLQRELLKTLVGDGDETVSNLRRTSEGLGRNWKRFCRNASAALQSTHLSRSLPALMSIRPCWKASTTA
jgi:hypothetical protein